MTPQTTTPQGRVIMTTDKLMKFCADENNIRIMHTLFKAIAYAEMVREIIEPKQREVIAFFKFEIAPELKRLTNKTEITTGADMYMASDEDMALYCKEMQKAYIELNLRPSKVGNCPLLEAESMVRNLKHEICEHFKPFFGFGSYELYGEQYRKYWDLLLTVFAPHVKKLENHNQSH